MSPRDTLSALLTATVWGLTFVAIKFGVGEAPPFLLTALRFAFADPAGDERGHER